MQRRTLALALIITLAGLLDACQKPKPTPAPIDAGPAADYHLLIQGVVTDALSMAPLSGVTVTVLGEVDASGTPLSPTAQTDVNGYFRFSGLSDVHDLMVQYRLAGYQTATVVVNDALLDTSSPCPLDGGTVPCDVPSTLRVVNANIALSQIFTVEVAGWVYAGTSPAVGAQVEIVTPEALTTPVYSGVADMNGHFDFKNVAPGTYDILVLPYFPDSSNGVDNYQLATFALGTVPNASENLTNIAITLQNTHHEIEGGTLINLSKPYPLGIDDLMTGDVTGIEAPLQSFQLQFGAEVDPTLTAFELVQYDQATRTSAPIPFTATWTDKVIVTITPTPPTADGGLTPSLPDYTTYQLRITALRFLDGTIAIPPSPTAYGSITFTIQELPPTPPNPTPSWYLATEKTATQTATQAVVDASHIWLLDKNGDFVFGTNPATNWGPQNLPQIQWQHQAGAVRYHVWARSVNPGPLGTVQQWQEIADPVPDTLNNLNPLITATIDPYHMMALSDPTQPWLFGESLQISVTSENVAGFQSPIDPTNVLNTADTFGGLIVGGQPDPVLMSGPFASTPEYGDLFMKTVRVDFSEPMNPLSPPTFMSMSPTLTLVTMPSGPVLNVGWGDTTAPSATPVNAASSVYAQLLMSTTTPCTEVLIDRFSGDAAFPVRDSSLFMVDPMGVVAFLDPSTGALLAEGVGVTAVVPGTITLAQGLMGTGTLPVVPIHSLACATDSMTRVTTTTVNASRLRTDLFVTPSMIPFYPGQTVALYEPSTATSGFPIFEVHTVEGYDSSLGRIFLDRAPTGGFAMNATYVFPVPLNGEYTLRTRVDLTALVNTDVPGMGPTTTIGLLQPAAITVGDTLLIDADGDLKTTADQVLTAVSQITCDLDPGAFVYSLQANVPTSLFLYQGTSVVIDLGDAIYVDGVHDTTPIVMGVSRKLDRHGNRLTAGGLVYGGPSPM